MSYNNTRLFKQKKEELSDQIASLAGLIPTEVGIELVNLGSRVWSSHAIVEIGSYKGKSTACLALGSKSGEGARVWAVDPWDLPGNEPGRPSLGFTNPEVREAFEQQLDSVGVRPMVTAVQAFSVDAAYEWNGPSIGLLFIDGDHTAEAITADIEAWKPHLADNAVIAFDDLDTPKNPGVRTVVDRLIDDGADIDVRAERLAVWFT